MTNRKNMKDYLEYVKSNRAITLVALVVTIIILIILATISIRMVIGEGGLIWQANNAKVEYRAATVDEEVLSWKAEKQVAEFNDKVQPKTRDELIDDQLERGLLTPEEAEDAKDDGKVKIGSRVIDYGEDGGVPSIPDGGSGQEGAIKYTDFSWTSIGKAEVKVNKNADNDYSMEYQVYDSVETEEPTKDWTSIENGDKVENLALGNVVKTAFTDGKGNHGGTADFTVTDTIAPESTASFTSATTNTDGSVTAKVTLTDKQSGIDLSKCKWVYNTDNRDILDDGSYIQSFTEEKTEDIELTLNTKTAGTYYLHILSVDKAGNKTKTKHGPITVNQLAKDISLNETQKEIETEGAFTLTATITPENATNQELIWSAEPNDVVSMTGSGKSRTITGLKEGKTTITVKLQEDESIQKQCLVTVTKGRFKNVTLEVGDYVNFYYKDNTGSTKFITCKYIRFIRNWCYHKPLSIPSKEYCSNYLYRG